MHGKQLGARLLAVRKRYPEGLRGIRVALRNSPLLEAPSAGLSRLSSPMFSARFGFIALIVAAFLASDALAQLPKVDPPRGWTNAKGQAFTATLLSFDGTTAIFKMPNGARAQAPSATLS